MENRAEKPWDDSLRSLVRASPQAFVSLVLGDAHFNRELPHKLKTWKQEVDSLLDVTFKGQAMLVHFEFQTYNDSTMAERMLRYNVLARSEYSLPVLSCVIYLLKDGNVPVSPLSWMVPTGHKVLDFYFESIELGEWPPEELLQKGETGLLPLLPLTRGGASREVATKMFMDLEAAGRTELIVIGATLASLVFSRENIADLPWLHRRLREMHNILRESPFYQEILQEGREEGLEEGLEKGHKEGKLEGLRETLLAIVQTRFPKVLRLAKGQAAIIDDPAALENLIVKVSIAQDAKEAKRALLDEEYEDD
jgi:predicted transposase YdaD